MGKEDTNMKKLVALVIALCLIFSATTALAAVDVATLKDIVEKYLQGEEYVFTYDEEQERFDMELLVENKLEEVDASIFLYDDMVSVGVYCLETVAMEQYEEMAILLSLINDDIYYASFRVTLDDGTICCRSANVLETVLPGPEEIDTLLHMPWYYMEKYGDAISAVINDGADGYTAYMSCAE